MIKNYLTVAFRNLFRNKVYSLINIFGLAIGMAAGFLIFEYVYFETTYDRFHKNVDRLYRVGIKSKGTKGWGPGNAATHPAAGPALKAAIPEVVDFVRLAPPNVFIKNTTVSYTDEKGQTKRFNEPNYYFADASFFNVFTFPLVAGDAKTALTKLGSIVITETMAKKYFGNANPLGKTIDINQDLWTVTAVCRDVPENSHVKFDMLLALNPTFGLDEWGWPEFYNYVLLTPGADPKKVEAKMATTVQKYLDERTKGLGFGSALFLHPVKDIHLKSTLRMEPDPVSNNRMVYFLSILGVFILMIAWINYINLSTAKSMERAREVGLRKVSGASRFQVSKQFLLEAMIVNTIALLIAALIVLLCTPSFETFIDKKVSSIFLSSGILKNWLFWLLFVAVFVAGILQTGVYPAFVLSAFNPALVLKGKFHRSVKGILLRKGLVTFQFVLSILLIAGSIIIYRQLSYMRNQEAGYDIDHLLVVKSPAIADSTYQEKVRYFKNELMKEAAVKGVAASSEIPGKRIFALNAVKRSKEDKKEDLFTKLVEIDKDFVPTYGFQLASGANLPDQSSGHVFSTLRSKVLINEELVKQLGFASNEAAVHQLIWFKSWFGDIECQVMGVVKNYHQQSMKDNFGPILYYYNDQSSWGYFSINLHTKELPEKLARIEQLYHQLFPGNAYESFFLNEYFNRQYKADQQFGNFFGLFTILAIFIACLGLTGLATYAIKIRTKEIGIRKVLGASAQGIVYLFYRDFIKLVCLAAVIAIPVVYFLASKWLENFAFHIQLGWLVFIAAPLLLMLIAFVTIGLQSFRAAIDNPVNSLRND
jgi:putative ABC transport system permease protein